MIKFIKNLQFIFMPHYWLMNESYSAAVDKKLNELLDKHYFTDFTNYTACLGDYQIWISNHPYASFHFYNPRIELRPSRLTILKASKHLKKSIEMLLNQKLNK